MIKLLVVDDSPLIRRLYRQLFEAEGDFELIFARDGVEALEAVKAWRPDVITLDVHMPQMGGLECLDRIMIEQPTPVVVASSLTADGAEEALRALELGAIDVIAKPTGAVALRMDEFGPPLVDKVRAAARARLPATRRLLDRVRARASGLATETAPEIRIERPKRRRRLRATHGEGVVIVGCSTGGPPALDAVLEPLPADFPWPIVVAQHMPASFTGPLARRLNGLCELEVQEVVKPTTLVKGGVYVARGDADLTLSLRGGALTAVNAPALAVHRWHPSVDRLVDSALAVMPAGQIVGVLLTGMGNDGAAAMARLKADGGRTIAEAEETAVVFGMPRALIELGGASETVPLGEIARRLLAAVTA